MTDEPTQPVRETREIDGQEIEVLVYENGLVKRADNGHFLQAPPEFQITPDRAKALVRRKKEQKRERIQAGANAATQKFVDENGDMKFDGEGLDWVEAMGESLMTVVLKGGNRSPEAARLLLHEAGISDDGTPEEPATRADNLLDKLGREAVMSFIEARKAERKRRLDEEANKGPVSSAAAGADVIEGETRE